MIGTSGVAVYDREDTHKDTAVSPPRDTRSTDAASLSFPLQLVIAIVVGCITIVGGQSLLDRGRNAEQAQIQSDVRDILTRLQYEKEMRSNAEKALESRFDALEAKIDASSLRSNALIAAITKQRED